MLQPRRECGDRLLRLEDVARELAVRTDRLGGEEEHVGRGRRDGQPARVAVGSRALLPIGVDRLGQPVGEARRALIHDALGRVGDELERSDRAAQRVRVRLEQRRHHRERAANGVAPHLALETAREVEEAAGRLDVLAARFIA